MQNFGGKNGDTMEDINKLLKEYDEKGMEEKLMEPYTYILGLPQKSLRTRFMAAFNHWLNIPLGTLNQIEEIVQMLHNASLMVDDIEDNSTLRRGFPVTHSVYSLASTLNTSNYMYFIVLEKCLKLGHSDAGKVFMEQMLELHRGTGLDIYWRDHFICPTESEYKLMATLKCGGLFMMAVGLMKLFSNCDKDFTKLIAIFGMYYQIHNDYKNLTSKEYAAMKTYCEDLTEGAFTFPILHAVNAKKNDHEILDILKQRTKDVQVKRHCVELIEAAGSFEYTRNVLKQLSEEARAEVARLGPNEQMDALLSDLFTLV